MEVGDLVLCKWQPKSRGVVNDRVLPMRRKIKGEVGFITKKCSHYYVVLFTHLGYSHELSESVLEVINE